MICLREGRRAQCTETPEVLNTLAQASENADAASRAMGIIREIGEGLIPSPEERQVLRHEAELLEALAGVELMPVAPTMKMLRARPWSLADLKSLAALFRTTCSAESAVGDVANELRRLADEAQTGPLTGRALS